MTTDFTKNDLNRVRRVPDRGKYDRETVYKIIDDALICHVGLVQDGQPVVIPTIHARDGDNLLLHGATTSRLIKYAASGEPLCVAITHLDGLVLARSSFHHSMNYRSAVIFGSGRLLDDPHEEFEAMKRFTNKLVPERWEDARKPNAKEIKATSIVSVELASASAKIRVGGPKDDDEDYALSVWAGVLPIRQIFGAPIADSELPANIVMPAYLRKYVESKR